MATASLGHLLDLMGSVNRYGPITITGMGLEHTPTVACLRQHRIVTAEGPTVTVALERLNRKLQRLAS
jgi:hypothetical protein